MLSQNEVRQKFQNIIYPQKSGIEIIEIYTQKLLKELKPLNLNTSYSKKIINKSFNILKLRTTTTTKIIKEQSLLEIIDNMAHIAFKNSPTFTHKIPMSVLKANIAKHFPNINNLYENATIAFIASLNDSSLTADQSTDNIKIMHLLDRDNISYDEYVRNMLNQTLITIINKKLPTNTGYYFKSNFDNTATLCLKMPN